MEDTHMLPPRWALSGSQDRDSPCPSPPPIETEVYIVTQDEICKAIP